MKSIFYIICIIFSLNAFSQEVISIERSGFYFDNNKAIPNTVREINDTNGILDKYVGIYQTQHDNNIIKLNITKKREHNVYRNVTEDVLEMNIYIEDLSGNIIMSTDDEGLVPGFQMSYSDSNKSYRFNILDACGRDLQVPVKNYIRTGTLPSRDGRVQHLEFWATHSTSKGPLTSAERPVSSCVSIANYLPYKQIVIFNRQ